MNPLTWIKSNLQLAGAFALCAVFGIALAFTGLKSLQLSASLKTTTGLLTKANDKLTAANADLATCRANKVTLNAALDTQNAAVSALKRESDAMAKQAAEDVRRAHSEADRYRRLAGKIPEVPTGDQCEAAGDVLRQALEAVR